MTLDAAHASFAEGAIGSLKKGKKADFIVLDRDIMRPDVVLANETWTAEVVATEGVRENGVWANIASSLGGFRGPPAHAGRCWFAETLPARTSSHWTTS